MGAPPGALPTPGPPPPGPPLDPPLTGWDRGGGSHARTVVFYAQMCVCTGMCSHKVRAVKNTL